MKGTQGHAEEKKKDDRTAPHNRGKKTKQPGEEVGKTEDMVPTMGGGPGQGSGRGGTDPWDSRWNQQPAIVMTRVLYSVLSRVDHDRV